MIERSDEWIRFPTTLEELNNAKTEWQKKYRFPFAIGAIDCTHVEINRPHRFAEEYVNRKNFHSFNVQATCDANELFTSIDCSWPGSVHDSRIWRNSECQQIMNENAANAVLIADDGYAVSPWMMTPYRQTDTVLKRTYNKLHKKERVIIEHMFGQVKQKFPILQNRVRVSTERIPSMVGACFVLHNAAKYLNDNEEFLDPIPIENVVNENVRGNQHRRGVIRRDEIARIISNRI